MLVQFSCNGDTEEAAAFYQNNTVDKAENVGHADRENYQSFWLFYHNRGIQMCAVTLENMFHLQRLSERPGRETGCIIRSC